ncbi:hypothetical protein IGI04_037388, partial [Brassica rapa subsp. trilocularis]
MDMKHRSGRSEKLEEENKWVLSRVVKTALKSCGIWSNHIKVESLKGRAAEESQTASLEKIHVKVEPLKEVAAEEGQTARLKWKGGTSCKRRRLRKLSKVWFMMRGPWREESESDDLRHMMGLKGIKDVVHQMVRGECSYSAYMGESVEDSVVLKEQEKGSGADDHITRKEWRVSHQNGTESGEQEQNQEDSGLHDQDTSQEVENNVQSSGEVDEVQSSGEVDEVQSSGEEEQVEPAS